MDNYLASPPNPHSCHSHDARYNSPNMILARIVNNKMFNMVASRSLDHYPIPQGPAIKATISQSNIGGNTDFIAKLGFKFDRERKEWYIEKPVPFWNRLHNLYHNCVKGVKNTFSTAISEDDKNSYLRLLLNHRRDKISIAPKYGIGNHAAFYEISIPEITSANYQNYTNHQATTKEQVEAMLSKMGFSHDENRKKWFILLPTGVYMGLDNQYKPRSKRNSSLHSQGLDSLEEYLDDSHNILGL